MKKIFSLLTVAVYAALTATCPLQAQLPKKPIALTDKAKSVLAGKQILFVERDQYAQDHHNTATLFQHGEINEGSFAPGAALRIYDVNNRTTKTLIETQEGVIRDPELSYDAKTVIFAMRKNREDFYHIYEINVDGSGLRQLTSASGVTDIDPLYLPDGGIVFTSTRQPKYCMCNRHIMGNLFRMNADGSNITQIGVSTLFEGHSSILSDGRIMYDRWEYVDRNFGDAQGLWTVNPDGTKHAIYYGNNTACPGATLEGRQMPGTDLVVCTFSSCHDRPWGALAVIDRKKGVDGREPVVKIWPAETIDLVGKGDLDSFKWISNMYEDPYPIDANFILASRTIWFKRPGWGITDSKQGLFLLSMDGLEELVLEGDRSLYDAQLVQPREKPMALPSMRNYKDTTGRFYVENVYEGTHMEGVKKGEAKWLRVVESPEKRTWTRVGWFGQGEQAPGMNWHSFENKRILGEVPIEEDGSASFIVPAGKHVYFQVLDKDKKMIQSMRSGVSLMPGEINGCVGCHEDRLSIPTPMAKRPIALTKQPMELTKWMGKEPFKFSFLEHVQPIIDKHCVKCHDFDNKNREKLVLARDLNPFFNAAYINLYVNKIVSLAGGGPANILQAYSWGSHASKLTKIIDDRHKGVKLNQKEKETLYTWMDLNGVYYPVYESSFDDTAGGRCPLTNDEVKQLADLTGINLYDLRSFVRTQQAQITFDRPELSPILDGIRNDKEKYREAVALLKEGNKRLKKTPRGDIESQLVPCERHKEMLKKYIDRLEKNDAMNACINEGGKMYDSDQQ